MAVMNIRLNTIEKKIVTVDEFTLAKTQYQTNNKRIKKEQKKELLKRQ